MSPGQGGLFRLVHSEALRQRVRRMIHHARERGITQELGSELRAIQDRLATDPETWGEEEAEYRYLGMRGRHAVTGMFHVRFAVHPTDRLVFVQDYIPLMAYAFLDEP
jgi:hypothetical protein